MILLDHTGVGLSSGNVPVTVTEMARDAIAFLDELEINGSTCSVTRSAAWSRKNSRCSGQASFAASS